MRLNFLRLKMRLPKYTAHIGIRGDSGFRFMYIDMTSRTLKYFDLLQDEKLNNLLGLTLCTEKELSKDGWYGAVMSNKQCLSPTERDLPSN